MCSFMIRFCVLFLVLSITASGKDRAFAIHMHRESKVGQKFRLAVKASMQLVIERHVGARSEKEKKAFDTDFVGVVTVLKTTKGGGKKKVVIVVEKFMITEEGFEFEGMPKGTRLIASLKDREVVFAEALEGQEEGKPLSEGIELDALQQVIIGANDTVNPAARTDPASPIAACSSPVSIGAAATPSSPI